MHLSWCRFAALFINEINMAWTFFVEGQSKIISTKLSWNRTNRLWRKSISKLGYFLTFWCRRNQSSAKNVSLWTILKEDQQRKIPLKLGWNLTSGMVGVVICDLKFNLPLLWCDDDCYDFVTNQNGLNKLSRGSLK